MSTSNPTHLATFPGYSVRDLHFYNLQQVDKNWNEWAIDQVMAGVGSAIQSLVSGILIGLSQSLIQAGVDKFQGDANKINTNVQPNPGYEKIKVAALSGDSDVLLNPNGSFKEGTVAMLEHVKNEMPTDYPVYLKAVAHCHAERRMQIRMGKILSLHPTKMAFTLLDGTGHGVKIRKEWANLASQYHTMAKIGMYICSLISLGGLAFSVRSSIQGIALAFFGGLGAIIFRDFSMIHRNLKLVMEGDLNCRERHANSKIFVSTLTAHTFLIGSLFAKTIEKMLNNEKLIEVNVGTPP